MLSLIWLTDKRGFASHIIQQLEKSIKKPDKMFLGTKVLKRPILVLRGTNTDMNQDGTSHQWGIRLDEVIHKVSPTIKASISIV